MVDRRGERESRFLTTRRSRGWLQKAQTRTELAVDSKSPRVQSPLGSVYYEALVFGALRYFLCNQ